MNSQADSKYRELHSHFTKTEPYGIYRNQFSGTTDPVPLHWHSEIEFFYLQEGKLDFFVNNTRYRLRGGDAMLVPPNLLHSALSVCGKSGLFTALVFSSDLVVTSSDTIRFRRYIQPVMHANERFCLHLIPENPSHRQILMDLERIFIQHENTIADQEKNPSDLLVEGLIRVIWQEIYLTHLAPLSVGAAFDKTEKQMEYVLEYIHQHYREDITLGMLAKTVHISEAQLCRSFKALTGSTPFSYLKKYRIMKSCEELVKTNKKISEICSSCGFNNISYYNREFLKIMKVTPSVYRKNIKLA